MLQPLTCVYQSIIHICIIYIVYTEYTQYSIQCKIRAKENNINSPSLCNQRFSIYYTYVPTFIICTYMSHAKYYWILLSLNTIIIICSYYILIWNSLFLFRFVQYSANYMYTRTSAKSQLTVHFFLECKVQNIIVCVRIYCIVNSNIIFYLAITNYKNKINLEKRFQLFFITLDPLTFSFILKL